MPARRSSTASSSSDAPGEGGRHSVGASHEEEGKTEAQKKKRADETVWDVLPDETRAELINDAMSEVTDIEELKLKVDKIRLVGSLHR